MGIFDFFRKKEKETNWIEQLPPDIANLLLAEIKDNPQACNSDEIPQGIGRFGLDDTNPIPVYGVPSNELYLGRLKLSDNKKIRWRRVGSVEISNIVKPVDKYEIFDYDGNTICFLYISSYHWKTSNKIPEGFKRK